MSVERQYIRIDEAHARKRANGTAVQAGIGAPYSCATKGSGKGRKPAIFGNDISSRHSSHRAGSSTNNNTGSPATLRRSICHQVEQVGGKGDDRRAEHSAIKRSGAYSAC